MPLRSIRGLDHLSEVSTPSGHLSIMVVPMTARLANWWHSHIQDDVSEARADHDWNWRLIASVTKLAAEALLQMPSGFVVGVRDEKRSRFVPCVMSMLVDMYPHLEDNNLTSVFVWYLSPAPMASMVRELELPADQVPLETVLMAVGMDVAITESYNIRLRGRVGLHADAKGGERLVRWYEHPRRGGMHRLPETTKLPFGFRRVKVPNDGRYFYHDEKSAFEASCRMDRYR